MKKSNIIFALALYAATSFPPFGGTKGVWLLSVAEAQNIGINTTGATPNVKAALDIDMTTGGLLIPRMTTTERNAITAPIPESLLIYNTTTGCFEAYYTPTLTWVAFGCIGCSVPSAVTASAAPNPICEGSTLTLTGGATNATAWQWTGPNSYSSTSQSPTIAGITTAGAGVYTLTASNTCASAAPVSTASVSVSAAAPTANAGTDITPACGVTTATLAGNTPSPGTGNWTVFSGTATITTPTSPASGVTGLSVPGTATLRWTISNAPCADSFDDVVITTTSCCPTYSTDFSTSTGWTTTNTASVEITNNELQYKDNYNNNYAYYDFGANISETQWIMRYKFNFSGTASTNDPLMFLALTDYIGAANDLGDKLGVQFYFDRNNTWSRAYGSVVDGSISIQGSGTIPEYYDIAKGTNYWIEYVRDNTTFTIKIYDNATYTNPPLSTLTQASTPSTIDGLRYIIASQYNQGNGITGIIDDLKFCDGVTSWP